MVPQWWEWLLPWAPIFPEEERLHEVNFRHMSERQGIFLNEVNTFLKSDNQEDKKMTIFLMLINMLIIWAV